jgi:RNA polymerase sigma-70 factor (ECF subfamily)
VIDEYRRAASLKGDVRREEPLCDDVGRPREVAARADTASDLAEAKEFMGRMRQLLPEDRREVLDLKADGLSSKEIGERLGLSERTVRRVIEDLRRRAEPTGDA